MARTPAGTIASVATAFANSLSFTAASNASECVLSVTGATLSAGDFVEVSASWGKINNRIYRLKAATATALTLEGCDTSDGTLFPVGGTGSVRKVNTWLPLSQQLSINATGGDAKQVNYTYVETGEEQNVFDGFGSTTYTIELDADSVGSAAYVALKAITDKQSVTALRLAAPSGSVVLLSCTAALNETPSTAMGAISSNKVTFFGRGRVNRYAA